MEYRSSGMADDSGFKLTYYAHSRPSWDGRDDVARFAILGPKDGWKASADLSIEEARELAQAILKETEAMVERQFLSMEEEDRNA